MQFSLPLVILLGCLVLSVLSVEQLDTSKMTVLSGKADVKVLQKRDKVSMIYFYKKSKYPLIYFLLH